MFAFYPGSRASILQSTTHVGIDTYKASSLLTASHSKFRSGASSNLAGKLLTQETMEVCFWSDSWGMTGFSGVYGWGSGEP